MISGHLPLYLLFTSGSKYGGASSTTGFQWPTRISCRVQSGKDVADDPDRSGAGDSRVELNGGSPTVA